MKINANYLKEQLKHVYWLNGGPCTGKSTMSIERTPALSIDEQFKLVREHFGL